ncbi:MAG: hypothetical protein AB3N16_10265 [Flavobacteriaceae bacterium]
MSLPLNNAEEVYTLVSTVEDVSINTNTLLLGDSVCRQLFGDKKDEDIHCLCENQAYEIPGNYLLLKTLLNRKAHFKNLVLMVNPRTLAASLNQKYTYNYFVKPFREHLDGLDEVEQRYINGTFPKKGFLEYHFSSFDLPQAYDIFRPEHMDSWKISEVNLKYIQKMDSLCRSNGIGFRMVAPPLPSNNKTYVEEFPMTQRKDMAPYFDSIIYYDPKYTKDGLHHVNPRAFVKERKRELDLLIGGSTK